MDNNSLKRISTSEAVVNYFKKEIGEGRLKGGDKLPSERELQNRLGISRFSLREGLARLSALGIIKIVHGQGSFISNEISSLSLENVLLPLFSKSDKSSLEDLFEVLTLIEGHVAYLAAFRRSERDLEDLQEILIKSEKAVNDHLSFLELDYQFHRKIAISTENVFFQKILDVLNEYVQSMLRDYSFGLNNRKSTIRSHYEIFNFIKKGDAKEAEKVTKNHVRKSLKRYQKNT